MPKLKVFIAEFNSPADFYLGRLDGYAAREVLKVRRIPSRYRIVFDGEMLNKAIAEALAFDTNIFHLSCHGDESGVQLADGEDIAWRGLADTLAPLASANRILVVSACVGGHVGLAKAFADTPARFGYLCGSSARDGVGFHDSCLAWSLLYNVLANRDAADREAFQDGIRRMNAAVEGGFVYRRWDGNKYLSYPRVR